VLIAGFGTAVSAQNSDNAANENKETLSPEKRVEKSKLNRGTDYLIVEEGDSLSKIARRYLGRREDWPTLWSFNPHITNPHSIYPGDIVYLRQLKTKDQVKAEQKDKEPEPRFFLSVGGFIKSTNRYVGRIMGSPKPGRLLGERDKVWIGYGPKSRREIRITGRTIPSVDLRIEKPKNRAAGEKFAVVREFGKIKGTQYKPAPRKFKLLGAVKLTDVNDGKYDEAVVSRSWEEIQRGDLLIPFEEQRKLVKPEPADVNIYRNMEIIDTLTVALQLGTFQYVFINKGAKQGIRQGNRLFAYQKPTGLRQAAAKDLDRVPWKRVGQIMIVDTTDRFSTGVIVDAKQELHVGDRLEMYEGF
jgi:nucleoid-associated protein YgaU